MADNCVFAITSAYTKKCFHTIGPNNIRKNFRFAYIKTYYNVTNSSIYQATRKFSIAHACITSLLCIFVS